MTARVIGRRCADDADASFDARALANVAWAYAKACHPDAHLFSSLGRAALRCLHDFNAQGE